MLLSSFLITTPISGKYADEPEMNELEPKQFFSFFFCYICTVILMDCAMNLYIGDGICRNKIKFTGDYDKSLKSCGVSLFKLVWKFNVDFE